MVATTWRGGGGSASEIQCVEASDGAKSPTMYRTAPCSNENQLAQNISSAPFDSFVLKEGSQSLKGTLVFKHLGGGKGWDVRRNERSRSGTKGR